jgi:hypothetical protein
MNGFTAGFMQEHGRLNPIEAMVRKFLHIGSICLNECNIVNTQSMSPGCSIT